MNYKECMEKRTYPIVSYVAVDSCGNELASNEDMKLDELGDLNVLAVLREMHMDYDGNPVPFETIVIGEPLKNDEKWWNL